VSGGFTDAARTELRNPQLRRNLRRATTTIRAKRAAVVAEVDEWEALRDAGRRIKQRALGRLDEVLEQLEASVVAAGGEVDWCARRAATRSSR
jgi:L-lactate dehydrogenase complex protein LldF